jgi:hypothetical protein
LARAAASIWFAVPNDISTFGGPATWASVLSFEKILEQGLIVNDGIFGYATASTVGARSARLNYQLAK